MREKRRASGATLEEIEVLYRNRGGDFRRLAAALVHDRERAVDVVQEAFAAAVRRRDSYRRDGPLDAWVCRIVVNLARNEVARRPRELPYAEPVGSNGDRSGPDADLDVALAALTDRQRLVVFLRYYADLDYRAIADTLDISAGTVAATLSCAHAALRRQLQEVHR